MIEHMEQCPTCRAAHPDFSTFLERLPVAEYDRVKGEILAHIKKGGLQERFIARARAAGIQFSDGLLERHQPRPRLSLSYRWVGAAAALGIVVALIGLHTAAPGRRPSPQAGKRVPEQNTSSARIQADSKLEAKLSELQAAIEAEKSEITDLQAQKSDLLEQNAAMDKDLTLRRSDNQALRQSLARMRELNTQQESQKDDGAQRLAMTEAELEEARSRVAAMEADVRAEKTEVAALSQQLSTQTSTIDRERDLLAAGRDITDLMGARNLHIIDVRDADGKGKNKKSFGRIFYTEGKSLIFYAYDLDESKIIKANYSFEVWGERLGEPTSVRNLGILYTDNKDQKRWAFKVDNQQQLAEIDSVFVTLEPHQGNSQPRGGRILFAYLGGKANHP